MFLLLHDPRERPDIFTDLVQKLHPIKIAPISPGPLREQARAVERFLDKHEVRGEIHIVARGLSGFLAQLLKERSPERFRELYIYHYPSQLLKLPRFIFRDKAVIPTQIAFHQVNDDAELLALLSSNS
ncbi:hypothetical protein N7326_06230 [Corynebacterium sp. ES2794-CONJ1]|uniref:hypothetical protein n=1 Tax=unclassified Corynebacterium TaxID=2624378 RepID=UPI00216A082C|nr:MULTISPECIES: hypothetical protein [unclassified Corynebacterium]MCS4490227.1 hypothetical protein [Corynebacterium sp. ES2775-CONJ]MCS4491962.1 hypothetical protein [Corynebacterium sp. ES2715-CONJ3]MCS4532066.1 hypothetical protein [Corynebacterium sp. ES2730-CONJ]MCU9519468.1 hypothetical protein [Corynebacterium sp. ES2794-CONJ1]